MYRWINRRHPMDVDRELDAQAAGRARDPGGWRPAWGTDHIDPRKVHNEGGGQPEKVAALKALRPKQLVAYVDAVLAEHKRG